MSKKLRKNIRRLCLEFIIGVVLIYVWWGVSLASLLQPDDKIYQPLSPTIASNTSSSHLTTSTSNYRAKLIHILKKSLESPADAELTADNASGQLLAMAQVPSTDAAVPAVHIDLPSTTAYQSLLLNATVNHQGMQQTTVFLQDKQGQIWASEEDLKKWRFNVEHHISINYDNNRYYALHGFQGVQYTINMQKLTLDIDAPSTIFESNTFSIAQEHLNSISRPQPGAFFNYDISWQRQTANDSTTGGIGELGLFNKYGVGTTSFVARQIQSGSMTDTEFVRLNTTWTYDNPEKMRTVRFGDTFTRPAMWGQSVGFGGIQFGTNFGTQPNFLRSPLLTTTGEAVLPSTVDLFVNNALISRREVNPGAFDVLNIPIINGYGELTVVSTDLLGRQQIFTLPYYGSSEILKPGLHDYSYEAGFIRRDLGSVSSDYGRFVLAGTDTFGVTNRFTAQWHAELLKDQQAIGLGGNYLWSTRGVWNFAGAVSHANHGKIGGLTRLGFQRNGGVRNISWGSNIQATTADFMDLSVQPGELAPSVQSQTFLGFELSRAGSLGISYTLQNRRDAASASLLSVSYGKTFFKEWAFGATVLSNVGGASSHGVFLTLNRALTEHTFLNLNGSTQTGNSKQGAVQINRPLPIGTGYGYSLSAGVRQNAYDYQAILSAQNNIGTYTAGIASQNNNQGYSLGAAGGVAYLDGHAYLSRQLTGSFAVVETGLPDVHIYEFNQIVGKTDKHGNILLPNLVPYQNNMLSLDPKDLPLNTQINSTQLQVMPYYRSGAVAKFPLKVSRSATLTVIDQRGSAIPLGATATVNEQNEHLSVGEDGQLFLVELAQQNKITLHLTEDAVCHFDLDYPETEDPLPDLGTYICR